MERVIEKQSDVFIPVGDTEVNFTHPLVGPKTYEDTAAEILSKNQRLPTGDETAFWLDRAYNSRIKGFKESNPAKAIRSTVHNDWIHVFNRDIWASREGKNPGLYVVQDQRGEGILAPFSLEELQDRLSGGETERGVSFSQDRTIRFAPYNTFILGIQKGPLANSGFVIANYGVEGAELIDKFKGIVGRGKPYIYGVEGNSEPKQRVAGLGRDCDCDFDFGVGYWLGLGGDNRGGVGGFASGVSEAA